MFRAAISRPIPDIGFNGKLMLRQICKEYKASETSINYKKCDRHDKHENYDGAMHIKLVKELCRCITVQFKGIVPEGTVINVQMDRAGPHASQAIEDAVEKMG